MATGNWQHVAELTISLGMGSQQLLLLLQELQLLLLPRLQLLPLSIVSAIFLLFVLPKPGLCKLQCISMAQLEFKFQVGVWFQSLAFSHIHGHMLLVSTNGSSSCSLLAGCLAGWLAVSLCSDCFSVLTVCHFDFMFGYISGRSLFFIGFSFIFGLLIWLPAIWPGRSLGKIIFHRTSRTIRRVEGYLPSSLLRFSICRSPCTDISPYSDPIRLPHRWQECISGAIAPTLHSGIPVHTPSDTLEILGGGLSIGYLSRPTPRDLSRNSILMPIVFVYASLPSETWKPPKINLPHLLRSW